MPKELEGDRCFSIENLLWPFASKANLVQTHDDEILKKRNGLTSLRFTRTKTSAEIVGHFDNQEELCLRLTIRRCGWEQTSHL